MVEVTFAKFQSTDHAQNVFARLDPTASKYSLNARRGLSVFMTSREFCQAVVDICGQVQPKVTLVNTGGDSTIFVEYADSDAAVVKLEHNGRTLGHIVVGFDTSMHPTIYKIHGELTRSTFHGTIDRWYHRSDISRLALTSVNCEFRPVVAATNYPSDWWVSRVEARCKPRSGKLLVKTIVDLAVSDIYAPAYNVEARDYREYVDEMFVDLGLNDYAGGAEYVHATGYGLGHVRVDDLEFLLLSAAGDDYETSNFVAVYVGVDDKLHDFAVNANPPGAIRGIRWLRDVNFQTIYAVVVDKLK